MNVRAALTSAAIALALACTLVAALLAGWQRERVANLLLETRFARAAAVLDLLETQQRDALNSRADIVASNQAFVSYVVQALEPSALPGMGVDSASLGDILRERREQLGFDALGLIGLDGRIIASTSPAFARGRLLSQEAFVDEAITGAKPTNGVLREGGLLLAAVRPLLLGDSVQGFLLAARRLDGDHTRVLATAADVEVALLAGDGRPPLAATLVGDAAEELAAQIGAPGSGRIPLQIAGEAHVAKIAPLFGDSDRGLGVVLIAPARPAELAGALWLPGAVLLGWILLVIALGALQVWRAWLRPLQLLPELLDSAATGDLRRVMPAEGGALPRHIAAAFNRLMVALRDRNPAPRAAASATPESTPR